MRKVLALLATYVVLVSCSGNGTSDGSTTTFEDRDTTTSAAEPNVTTTAPTSTTTTPPTTTTTPPPTTTTSTGQLGPEGSGCTPGPGDLPDGDWYGEVVDFDETGISFDLACWFSGDAATAAAAEDGEESPPPNDYYVRNQNTQTRELDVASSAEVTWYSSGDPNDEHQGTFAEWAAYVEERGFMLGIWVTVANGQVTGILEQWVP